MTLDNTLRVDMGIKKDTIMTALADNQGWTTMVVNPVNPQEEIPNPETKETFAMRRVSALLSLELRKYLQRQEQAAELERKAALQREAEVNISLK